MAKKQATGQAQLGVNAVAEVEGKQLVIRVDLTERHGDSASGKTVRVASSLGNKAIPGYDKLRVGLNVYEQKGTTEAGRAALVRNAAAAATAAGI